MGQALREELSVFNIHKNPVPGHLQRGGRGTGRFHCLPDVPAQVGGGTGTRAQAADSGPLMLFLLLPPRFCRS